MDELKLKNLQAMADSEREQKEDFLKQITQSIEILNNLEDRICTDNGIPTKQHKPNEPLISVVRSLSINAIAIMAEMKRKTTQNGYDVLKAEFDKLVIEKDSLLEAAKIPKQATTSTVLGEELITTPPEQPEREEESSVVDEIKAILSSTGKSTQEPEKRANSPASTSITDQVLKLAGECNLYKLNDFIDLGTTKLNVSDIEIKRMLEDLEASGLLLVERSTIKPTGHGIAYPVLFHLTPQGLKQVKAEKISEIDRWIQHSPGLSYPEIPLMVYAAEEYLPKHNYTFVDYFPKVTIELPDGTNQDSYPHIHLKDENHSSVYVMFGNEAMDDKLYESNCKDHRILNNNDLFILCSSARIARIFSSKCVFAKKYDPSIKTDAKITNVADWPTYDQMLKSGNANTPKSIWFTYLMKGN